MLVYKGADGSTHSNATSIATRRKKSTGELFQKGYRVRMGHGQVIDKEDQDSICFSLGACFHIISYWGKTCRTWTWGGSLSKAEGWRVKTLWTVCVSWSRFWICCALCSPSGKRSLEMKIEIWQSTQLYTSFFKHYLFIFLLAEWLVPCFWFGFFGTDTNLLQ